LLPGIRRAFRLNFTRAAMVLMQAISEAAELKNKLQTLVS
jgi:hypothetical protein